MKWTEKSSKLTSILLWKYDYEKGSASALISGSTCSKARKSIHFHFIKARTAEDYGKTNCTQEISGPLKYQIITSPQLYYDVIGKIHAFERIRVLTAWPHTETQQISADTLTGQLHERQISRIWINIPSHKMRLSWGMNCIKASKAKGLL